jgi:peroxiredoxin family protein
MSGFFSQFEATDKSNGSAPRKLALVASKGSLDMAYPPLILANAALMSGIETHVFFTFWGLDIITKAKQEKIKIATVGNPSFTMAPYAPHFYIPTWMGAIPGMVGMATWMMHREIDKLGFPPIPEFVDMVRDAGGCLYGCKMSMEMMGLTVDDLVDGADMLGAMEFLEIADGAQVIFV